MSARHVKPFFDNVMEQNVLHGHNEISFYMTKMPDRTSAVREPPEGRQPAGGVLRRCG